MASNDVQFNAFLIFFCGGAEVSSTAIVGVLEGVGSSFTQQENQSLSANQNRIRTQQSEK